jgi:hypothetical protein
MKGSMGGWGHSLSGTAFAYLAQGPAFNPQCHKRKKERKKRPS